MRNGKGKSQYTGCRYLCEDLHLTEAEERCSILRIICIYCSENSILRWVLVEIERSSYSWRSFHSVSEERRKRMRIWDLTRLKRRCMRRIRKPVYLNGEDVTWFLQLFDYTTVRYKAWRLIKCSMSYFNVGEDISKALRWQDVNGDWESATSHYGVENRDTAVTKHTYNQALMYLSAGFCSDRFSYYELVHLQEMYRLGAGTSNIEEC